MAGVEPIEGADGSGVGVAGAPVEEPRLWPYVIPLGGFLALTALESYLPTAPGGGPSPAWYTAAYALKLVVVGALLWVCRSTFRDLRPWPTPLGAAAAVALGLDGHYPVFEWISGRRSEFNPNVLPPPLRVAFLALRLTGLVVVVPLVEELFYRSFLMRWVIDPDVERVPIGRVTPLALAVTSGVFALSHPEWLPALLTGLAWGGLVWWTKSVSACVLSHATANLALGAYVLATHSWRFW